MRTHFEITRDLEAALTGATAMEAVEAFSQWLYNRGEVDAATTVNLAVVPRLNDVPVAG